MSLSVLIKKCKQQELSAQEQLYRRYSGTLFSICLKYANDRSSAEDILQDAFITIFSKISQYKGKGSFEGWMKRITINTALQRFRTQKVYDIACEEQLEDVEVTVDIDEEQISLDCLLQLIRQLPDRYRLVFNLYVLDGYSHKEIAALLKISVGTSKSNLSRARNILKEKLETNQEMCNLTIEEGRK